MAIQAIVRGALGTKISLIIDSYMKKPQSAPGLELLRLILKEHATHHETDIIYQITDLLRASVHNGDLESFLNTWDLIRHETRGSTQSGSHDPLLP